MQRSAKSDSSDFHPPQLPRSQSTSSDRTPSMSGSSSLLSPPSAKPDPAYIAASAASQIVNSDLADRDETFDGNGKRADADAPVVSPTALILLNAFLDQLLFSFLASSRSTSIAALRPAILEVLKPRLGKEAIDGADEELQGYLAGGDAEELLAFHGGQDFKGEYNLNLVWRRTRLRCMVYTRLGDMEEEDEEMYLEQEHRDTTNDGRPRLTRDLGEISPAAAIFLTSIVEFIGEHALLIAGEAAYNRYQMKKGAERSRLTVEEVDMEKIAFNTTLGRLWRSWKKRVRTSTLLSPRPMSRQRGSSVSGGDSSRKTSISEDGYFDSARRPSVAEVLHEKRETPPQLAPEDVALPEEPDFEEEDSTAANELSTLNMLKARKDRPRSMIEFASLRSEPSEKTPTQKTAFNLADAPASSEQRPVPKHKRSSSVPVKQTVYGSPVDETFITPNEGPDPLSRETSQLNNEKVLPKLTDDSKTVDGGAAGTIAVSTMYDGTLGQNEESLPRDRKQRNDRGISTYTETSSYTDEYDPEMAPEALKMAKSGEKAKIAAPESRASTASSGLSFRIGEQDPVVSTGGAAQSQARESEAVEDTFPRREASLDQTGVDAQNGRQHVGNIATLATLSGHQLRTFDRSGKAVKRDIPVLYEAPSNKDVIYNPEASVRSSAVQDEEEMATPRAEDPAAVEPRQGVPALTPLRELMDAAHDTSDEASSQAPSYGTPRSEKSMPMHPFQSAEGQRVPSYTSSTSAAKLVDLRSQPPTVNTGAERAAVQRVSPSAPSPLTPTGRNSKSNDREVRPGTASSMSSQMSSKVKGMIGRESGDNLRGSIPHRTSSGDTAFSNGQVRTPRSADKEMDFEELIKSDETVKYTLTPQNMREMESPDSLRYQGHHRTDTADSSRSVAKLKGVNGLRANPTNGISQTAMAQRPSAAPTDTSKAQQNAPIKVPGVVRSPGGPREPVAKDDSLRDFADFIRSTGPDTAPKAMPRGVTSNAARPISSSSPRPPPKKITKPSPQTTPKGSISGPKPEVLPKRTTSKLQAREATVTNNNATADLADFLRSGPAGAQVEGAASRQRMQPTSNGLANGRMREAVNSGSSVASTQDSFAPSKMTQSSANSRTGLLDNTNRVAPPIKNNVRQPTRGDNSGPARTQRRVRDPYALDSDDDEDGYSTAQPPEREEESLSDFLRNYNPPPTVTNNARSNIAPVQTTAPAPKKQKTTVRERIARNIAVIPDYRPLPPKTPKKNPSKSPPQSNESRNSAKRTVSHQSASSSTGYQAPPQQQPRGRPANAAPQLPPLQQNQNQNQNQQPRPTSPHLVSQNGTKMDTYRPTQPTYAKHVDRAARPKMQLQAREEHGALSGPPVGSGMGDLADFLRETEPPPQMMAGMGMGSGGGGVGAGGGGGGRDGGESAFGRMFSRRKKEGR